MARTRMLCNGQFFANQAIDHLTSQGGVAATYSGNAGSPGYDPGIVYINTGGSSSGTGAVGTMTGIIGGAVQAYYYKCIIAANDGVSSGTQRYTIRAGFMDSFTAEPSNGHYFRYTDSVNSGKWQCVSRKAGVETAVDSTVTYTYGATLEIFRNASNNSIAFASGGVIKVTTTDSTYIPTAAYGFGISIIKSIGTTARGVYVDEVTALI